MSLNNIGKYWTASEVQLMEDYLSSYTYGETAVKLGRSITAVIQRHRMVMFSEFLRFSERNPNVDMTIIEYRRLKK